jgi:protein SCO1/2
MHRPATASVRVSRSFRRTLYSCVLSLLFLPACKKSPVTTESSQPPAQNTNQRVFQVKGVVKAIKPARKEIEIKHEAIPDYMPAMTMPFDVKDTNELTGLAPEQPISFRLTVTDTEGWVDKIQPLGPPLMSAPSNGAAGQLIRAAEPLQIGQPLPEYRFTNQFGQTITTTQFKGDALAITFLFTRCPFPTFCPRLANDFSETQQKLLALQNAPTNWKLLTISFDPDFDRPEVLKSYAEAHHYEPEHWTFATGAPAEVSNFGDLFGLVFWKDATGSISHNMRTAVIDSNGRLQRVFEGKDWTSVDLVTELVKAAKP